jgi:hypothetical protein
MEIALPRVSPKPGRLRRFDVARSGKEWIGEKPERT